MRITEHPILRFERGRQVEFEFDGEKLRGFEGETIAAALHAHGVRVLRKSIKLARPRGFFCAIGRCSSCLMTVDGVPNIMTCITPLKEGANVQTQEGKGALPWVDPLEAPPMGIAEPEDLGTTPLAIVGAGPAGLSAALSAGRLGVRSVVVDESERAGGQLIKQSHMFFGSKEHYARVRGIDIGEELLLCLQDVPSKLLTGTTVLGLYQDGTLSLLKDGKHAKLRASCIVVAGGASENMLAFENCDLPGVYGAGAVQTLMNVYGVVPGKRVLMVGAGNIGLIVSYQLLQAGVDVAAVIDAMPEIGGYHVHAAKIRRAGIPILTSHTIVRAIGADAVEAAAICAVDEHWQPVPGTDRKLDVDTICLAVGLSPNCDLLFQLGCESVYIPELGGCVALHDENLETTVPGVFVAGDASGIEEASTAMLEGRLAGLGAAQRLLSDASPDCVDRMKEETRAGLAALRAGPFGEKPRSGKETMFDRTAKAAEVGE